MSTCDTCKWWAFRGVEEIAGGSIEYLYGECTRLSLHCGTTSYIKETIRRTPTGRIGKYTHVAEPKPDIPSNGVAVDALLMNSRLLTGPDFGCIHHVLLSGKSQLASTDSDAVPDCNIGLHFQSVGVSPVREQSVQTK